MDHCWMKVKTLSGYIAVVTLSFLLYAARPAHSFFYGALPALMLIFPTIAGSRVRISFSVKDLLLGIAISFVVLVPYSLFFGSSLRSITFYSALFQLLSVALPEEFFFRGFLQHSLGKSLKAVLFASLLFSLAHLPRAVFLGDWVSLLSFFPSLIIGWLYMKTNNIVPGIIFHLFGFDQQ